MAQKFKTDKKEVSDVVSVFLWSFGSAFIALIIGFVATVDFPPEYAVAIPAVNTSLYSIKKFVTENAPEASL